MTENLALYEKIRSVPPEAQKKISAGRLKGKTDINPMWRIKALTEQFGPWGIGWKYEITRQWLETGANDEVAAFCNINLYVKWSGEWSEAIPGTGGRSFVANQSSGKYTNDECYKMALTDAISVACKALGMGANVYWGEDKTKYDAVAPETQRANASKIDEIKQASLLSEIKRTGWTVEGMLQWLSGKSDNPVSNLKDITLAQYVGVMQRLERKPDAAAGA